MRRKNNPMQPVVLAENGSIRFKENAIIISLLEFATQHGYGLNSIAAADYSDDDYSQLMELIGYSVSGYGNLSRCNKSHMRRADKIARDIISDLKDFSK